MVDSALISVFGFDEVGQKTVIVICNHYVLICEEMYMFIDEEFHIVKVIIIKVIRMILIVSDYQCPHMIV